MNDICLVFPPLSIHRINEWDNYPSINLLSYYLSRKQVDCTNVDFNQLFINYLLHQKHLQGIFQKTQLKIDKYESCPSLSNEQQAEYFYWLSFLKALKLILEKQISHSEQFWSDEFYKILIEGYNLFHQQIRCFTDSELISIFLNEVSKRISIIFQKIIQVNFVQKYALYGISVPSAIHFPYALLLSKEIKTYHKDAFLVLGGPFISLMDEKKLGKWIKNGYFDSFIKFSGEKRLFELWKQRKTGNKNSQSQRHLNSIDYEIEIDNQHTIGQKVRQKMIKILLTKNCYWGKCSYCDYVTVNSRFQCKSPEIIRKEILHHFHSNGIRSFHFITDALPPALARKISYLFLENNIQVQWSCNYLRIDPKYNSSLLSLMKESGFDFLSVTVGIDSLSNRALTWTQKGYTLHNIIQFFESASKEQIVFGQVNIIPDLPGSVPEETINGLNYLRKYSHVYNKLAVFPFRLTSTSKMGNHLDSYGLEVLQLSPPVRDDFYYSAVHYSDTSNQFDDKQEAIVSQYITVAQMIRAAEQYPKIDKRIFSSIRNYDETKYALMLQLPSDNEVTAKFAPSGKKFSKPISISLQPTQILDDDFLTCWNYFISLEPNRWYSLGQILKQTTFENKLIQVITKQILFRTIVNLMTKHYFADAMLQKGLNDS